LVGVISLTAVIGGLHPHHPTSSILRRCLPFLVLNLHNEFLELLQGGRVLFGFLNGFGSIVAGLLGVFVGFVLGGLV
jgi:hypothetical protein